MAKKVLQISHSAAQKLHSCGFMYEQHYINKLRSKWAKVPFIFGNAIDEALNTMLSLHGEKVDQLEKAYDTFDDLWEKQQVNKKEVYLQTHEWILYGQYDHDFALIDEDELEELKEVAKELGSKKKPLDWAEEIKKKLKQLSGMGLSRKEAFKKLTVNQRRFWNAFNWGCMRHKAYILLEAFYNDIFTKITKVHGVQVKIQLKSKEGHKIIGYIDAIVELEGVEGLVVMDNKTSAREYEEDSVITSAQLATYCYVKELENAAYAVMLKSIDKNTMKVCTKCGHIPKKGDRTRSCASEDKKGNRCGGEYSYEYEFKGKTQLIVDEIPYEVQHMVMKNLDQALLDLHNERFTKNLTGCDSKYGRCDYFDKCWKGKSDKECDLIVVGEKKAKK